MENIEMADSAPSEGERMDVDTQDTESDDTLETGSAQKNDSVRESSEEKAEKAKQAEKRKYKVKVDEEEEEVDEDELLRGYQKAKASDKRFQESALLKKQVEQLLNEGRSNPSELLKVLGVNSKEFAEQLLLAELEESLLSPEQKEMKRLKGLEERWMSEQEKRKQAQEEQERAELTLRAEREIEEEIMSAIKASGRKPTPQLIAKTAEMILHSLDSEKPLRAQDAYETATAHLKTDLQRTLQSMSPEEIQGFLGPELLKQLRAHDLQTVRNKSGQPSKEQAQSAKKQGKRRMSLDDLFPD